MLICRKDRRESKVVLRPVCSRHGIGISVKVFSMKVSSRFYDNARTARWNARSFLGSISGVLSRNKRAGHDRCVINARLRDKFNVECEVL